MSRNDALNKAVLDKLAESDGLSGEGQVEEAKVDTTEPVAEQQNTEEQADATPEQTSDKEKKTGLQKRLDKLHRDKMAEKERADAEKERADALEAKLKQLDGKMSDTSIESEQTLDEEGKKIIEKIVEGVLESQLKQREERTRREQLIDEQKQLTQRFEHTVLKAFEKEFDEESGMFSEKAIEKMKTLHEQFQASPKFWLSAMDKYGVEKAYDLATLSDLPTAMSPKKDSVDKILEKERLMKSVQPSSSNVVERVQRQSGENQKSYLSRIISSAIDKI
jgi:hypothetical protein